MKDPMSHGYATNEEYENSLNQGKYRPRLMVDPPSQYHGAARKLIGEKDSSCCSGNSKEEPERLVFLTTNPPKSEETVYVQQPQVYTDVPAPQVYKRI